MRTRSRRHNKQAGSAVLEIALMLLPLMLLIIGALDISRAVWTYHSLAMAVKTATRQAIVHGARCADASSACPITVADVVAMVNGSVIGLDRGSLQLTLGSAQQTLSCSSSGECSTNGTAWPPPSDNAVGQLVTISARYAFQSFLPVGSQGRLNLTATSTEMIEF